MYLIVKEAVFVYIIKVHLLWDYKSSLALRLIEVHYLQECLFFEILICGKTCNFISLYRSPSQSSDSFKEFADNLQLSLDKISNQNPFLTVVLGDFNTKSSNWYKHDKTTYEGSKIDAETSQYCIKQLIKERTDSHLRKFFILH